MSVDDFEDVERRALVAEALAVVAHDVRNRLASTRQALYFLKTRFEQAPTYRDDPRVERFFVLADGEVEAAGGILNGTEVLAHFGAPTQGPADVRDALELATAGVDGRVERDASAGTLVAVDRRVLAHALRHLLQNAVEAGPPGEPVHATLRVDGATCIVRIDDRGPGFDAAALRKFVQRFFTTKPGRLGLGASMARRTIATASGKLVAVGVPGGTGSLEVHLPIEGKP